MHTLPACPPTSKSHESFQALKFKVRLDSTATDNESWWTQLVFLCPKVQISSSSLLPVRLISVAETCEGSWTLSIEHVLLHVYSALKFSWIQLYLSTPSWKLVPSKYLGIWNSLDQSSTKLLACQTPFWILKSDRRKFMHFALDFSVCVCFAHSG